MQIFRIIKPLRFMVILCILNIVLCFLIEPANGASETMWRQYYETENIDMVFVGDSVCAATFDPVIFNEKLGVEAFNMGTPMQAMEQSLRALETAFEEHEINMVVLGMGFYGLQAEPLTKAELTFEKAAAAEKGGMAGVMAGIEYLLSEDVVGTEKSVNFFFPWLYNQITISWGAIGRNISAKLNPIEKELDPVTTERAEWSLERGYRPFTGDVDYENAWNDNSFHYYSQDFDVEAIESFKAILELCKEEGADVIVVNSPHPTYDVVACSDAYLENETEVALLCKEYGVEYYNFSLAKTEIFDSKPEYYYDFEHLNYQGSQLFSKAFCEFLMRRANGEKLSRYFYSVEEYYEIHEELLEEWKSLYGTVKRD